MGDINYSLNELSGKDAHQTTQDLICYNSLVQPKSKLSLSKPSFKGVAETPTLAPVERKVFGAKEKSAYQAETDYFDANQNKVKPERLYLWEIESKDNDMDPNCKSTHPGELVVNAQRSEKACVDIIKNIYGLDKIGNFAETEEICTYLPDHKLNPQKLNNLNAILQEGDPQNRSCDSYGIKGLNAKIESKYIPAQLVSLLGKPLAVTQDDMAEAYSTSTHLKEIVTNGIRNGALSLDELQKAATVAQQTAARLRKTEIDLKRCAHPLLGLTEVDLDIAEREQAAKNLVHDSRQP